MPRSISTQTLTLTLLTLLAGAPLAADDAPQPEELFRTLDANGDGILTADEIGEPQRRAFERLLRVGDADRDGSLTREEYLKALRPDPPVGANPAGSGREAARGGPPQRPDFGRLFDLADRDGDGKIALTDLPEPARERMQPLFQRLGREQLTREDFERLGRGLAAQRAAARPQDEESNRRLFERFDKNSDGKLTRDEIPQPLRRRFEPLFEQFDRDELTREDFRQALQQPPAEGDSPRGEAMRPGEAMRSDETMRPDRGGLPLMMLGRMLDADGDAALTIDEIDRLNDLFAEFDADKDGRLSGAELRAFAERLTSGGTRRPTAGPEAENRRPRRPDESPRGSD
jgi:Ca2+-binding EF-hand superfamily protein